MDTIKPFSKDISYGNESLVDEASIPVSQKEYLDAEINMLQERPPEVRKDLRRRVQEFISDNPMTLISKPALRKLNNDRREWIMDIAIECFDPDNELLEKHGHTSSKYLGALQKFMREENKKWYELHPLGKNIKLENLMVSTTLTNKEKKQLKSLSAHGEYYHKDKGWY